MMKGPTFIRRRASDKQRERASRASGLRRVLPLAAAVLSFCVILPLTSCTGPEEDYSVVTALTSATAAERSPSSGAPASAPTASAGQTGTRETTASDAASASAAPTDTPTGETPTTTTPTDTPTGVTPTTTTPTDTPTGETPTSPTPTRPGGKRVSFLAAGDNIIHEAVYTDAMALATAQAAVDGYGERYRFDPMYERVKDLIGRADVSFVNMECPIAGEEYGISGYPFFNAPFEAAETLERLGFDVVNVANNHMLDMESRCTGYRNTVASLKRTAMTVIGGYTKDDYDDLRIVVRNGVKIAFLSYTTCLNNETVNPASPEMIIPYPAESDIVRQMKKARANADFVIVSMHWGTENSSSVNDTQRRLAKLLCENGADVIVGHHSHTVQPAEWIEANGRRTLCYYSLGNFISTQHPIKNLIGIFAAFDLVVDETGVGRVENARAIPHMTWYSTNRDSLKIYLLDEVTKELIESHGSQLRISENGGTFTLETVIAIVKEQFPVYDL